MGDFNCWPNSVPMNVMRQFVKLQDAWICCNPDVPVIIPTADCSHVLTVCQGSDGAYSGCTFGTADNEFSYHKGVAPQRLDYIMYLRLTSPRTPSTVDWSLASCSLFIDYLIDTSSHVPS